MGTLLIKWNTGHEFLFLTSELDYLNRKSVIISHKYDWPIKGFDPKEKT